MKVVYRGHIISAVRDKTLAGWSCIDYYIERVNDGFFLEDTVTYDEEITIREFIAELKIDVDEHIDNWKDSGVTASFDPNTHIGLWLQDWDELLAVLIERDPTGYPEEDVLILSKKRLATEKRRLLERFEKYIEDRITEWEAEFEQSKRLMKKTP